jgi:spore coat protein U-like protein
LGKTQQIQKKYPMEEMTMKKQILSLAAGAALVFAAQNGFAQTSPLAAGSLNYEVILNGGCSVITSLGSGAIKNLATQSAPYTDVTADAGSVTVNCTNTTPYAICVDGGKTPTATTRQLKGIAPLTATDLLAYDLKGALGADTKVTVGDKGCLPWVAETAAWADPLGGAITAGIPTATGTSLDQTYNLTADVTIATTAKPGTYQDLVTLNVVW